MDLVVLVKKMSVHIIFLLENTKIVSLAKSSKKLLVMSDRPDKFRELWETE